MVEMPATVATVNPPTLANISVAAISKMFAYTADIAWATVLTVVFDSNRLREVGVPAVPGPIGPIGPTPPGVPNSVCSVYSVCSVCSYSYVPSVPRPPVAPTPPGNPGVPGATLVTSSQAVPAAFRR